MLTRELLVKVGNNFAELAKEFQDSATGWCVIVVTDKDRDQRVIGPFKNGEGATNYGFINLKDQEWCWIPLTDPYAS